MGSNPQVSILKGPQVPNERRTRLHQLFSANAARSPNDTALIYQDAEGKEHKWSYLEIEEKSNRFARAVMKLTKGLPPNNDNERVIGIALAPGHSVIVSILAIWKAGCSYLPFNKNAPVNRVKHIIEEAKPILVITDEDETNGLYLPSNAVSFNSLDALTRDLNCNEINDNEVYPASFDPIIIILYTSGSTGISKGVRVRNSSALNRLHWQWRAMPYEAGEKHTVFKTSLTFVDSVPEIWSSLLDPNGVRTLVVVPTHVTSNPQKLVTLLNKYKVGRLLLVPSLLNSILMYLSLSKDHVKLLEKLKVWVCSGETLSVSLACKFFEYFPAGHCLNNFYGSTEIMGDVSFYSMTKPDHVSIENKVPIGIPLDNTMLYLLDDRMKIVNLGEMGELYVAGRHLADGYVNKRDTFRFVDNPHTVDPDFKILYKTGDYARIIKDTLIYEGRTDSQIKVRGNRVDLAEVEVALNKFEDIEKAVVLCSNPGEVDQQIIAFVLPKKANIPLRGTWIEKELLKSVAEYAIPQVVIVSKIPYLVNGKVDRQSLLKTYKESAKDDYINANANCIDMSGVKPSREKEASCLFKTISEVLGSTVRSNISIESNFYSLGGNSLNSVITISKLKEQGFNISITDFISAKNLGEIADKMSKEGNDNIICKPQRYMIRMMKETDKDDVIRIIADSFYHKADIETIMSPSVDRSEYLCMLESVWPCLIKHNMSIVAEENGKVMGASLVFDMDDEPSEIELKSQLQYVLEFLDYVEVPIREKVLPKNVKILHSFMLGTDQRLSAKENVEITDILESNLTKIGRERGYAGIFSTNTSPLTQQLAVVQNYNILKKYQINQYVAPDGTRPFKLGPDSLVAVVVYRDLTE